MQPQGESNVPSEASSRKDEPVGATDGSYWLVTILSVFAAMGGFMYGFDTGTISGYISMDEFLLHFGQVHEDGTYYLSNVRSGLIVSMVSIGACIGGIFLSGTADMYGRKFALFLAAGLYVIGYLIQITAMTAWYQVMIGRIVAGLGIGTIAVVVPMFQSETAPPKIRGALVTSFQLMITLGIFIGYCVCYGTYDRADTGAYRIGMGLCFAWALLFVIGLTFMPESPRYLISKDRVEDATRSMSYVCRKDPNDPEIVETINEIAAGVAYEKSLGKASWTELITGKPRVFFRLFVGVVVAILQQFVGANYFFYYGTTVFKAIGMTNSFATSMIFGAVNFVSTFFGIYIVDRFGRRMSLFWGAVGMFVFFIIYSSLGVRALYPNGEDQESSHSVGSGMIAVTCFYIFCFATTWAPIAFVYISEIFPMRVKSHGMAISLGGNWIGNFLLSFFTPFITGAIGFAYGYVFSGCCLFAVFFVLFFVHETKDLTLEQINEMYASNVGAFASMSWKPSEHLQPSANNGEAKPGVEATHSNEQTV